MTDSNSGNMNYPNGKLKDIIMGRVREVELIEI